MTDVHRVTFLRIAAPTPVRLHTGKRDRDDAPGDAGQIYRGGGAILSLPSFRTATGGRSQRIEFPLSGLDPQAAALWAAGQASWWGSRVTFSLCFLTPEGQPRPDADWPVMQHRFRMDSLWESFTKNSDGVLERSLMVSAASPMITRKNRRPGYMTDADQQKEHPGDLFFNRVAAYYEGIAKPYGPNGD